jgi:hypothetical protein
MEIRNNQPPQSSSTSLNGLPPQPPLPPKWGAEIFAKLQARYGHKMSSSYPAGKVLDLAIEEWCKALAGFGGEEIKRGLESWKGDWPPSLIEFKQSCRPKANASHADQTGCAKLPRPASDKNLAREEMQRIQEYLKMAEPAPPRSDKEAFLAYMRKHFSVIKRYPLPTGVTDTGALSYD